MPARAAIETASIWLWAPLVLLGALAVSTAAFLAISNLVLLGAIIIIAGWAWQGRRPGKGEQSAV